VRPINPKEDYRMSRALSLFVALVCLQVARAQSIGLDIRALGAVGDEKTMNTTPIQHAIDSVYRMGGGSVCVPAGVFLSGTLELRSNVDLHLERGAVLKGSANKQDYVLNGKVLGLIFTQNAKNVSITGLGTIDGNGDSFMELGKAKHLENAGVMWTRQGDQFRRVTEGIGDGPVVPKDRPFQMIIFSDCRNVTVRDVLISNSPFWTLHCADCDGVIVSGVRIWCNLLVPNNDGVDFTSCSNVLMSDCDIRTGDDCIVLTGYSHHFDLPGFKDLHHDSENITITNCTLVSRSSAIRVGGFDQNSMRNYVFSNLTITNSNRGIGIFVRDRGSIENLVFSNIVIDTRLHTGDWWGNGEPIHLSAVRLTKDVPLGKIKNVEFQNIICAGESGILVYGTQESVIEDVAFNGVKFHMKGSKLNALGGGNFDLRPVLDPKLQLFAHDIPGLYAQCVRNLRIEDFDLTWEAMQFPFFTHGIEIRNFDGVKILSYSGSGALGNPKAYPIALYDGRGYQIEPGRIAVLKKGVRE
jgi:polygalacturonase